MAMTQSPNRSSVPLEISSDGYLHLNCDAARKYFPEDVLVPLWRTGTILLLPTRGPAAGGLMLKQRNPAGDRCLLISEVLNFQYQPGVYQATWDDQMGALKLELPPSES